MSEERGIVTFPSTHSALNAERVARKAGLTIAMIPVPRWISSDCNMGMAVSMEDKESLKTLLVAENIQCGFVAWQE